MLVVEECEEAPEPLILLGEVILKLKDRHWTSITSCSSQLSMYPAYYIIHYRYCKFANSRP